MVPTGPERPDPDLLGYGIEADGYDVVEGNSKPGEWEVYKHICIYTYG